MGDLVTVLTHTKWWNTQILGNGWETWYPGASRF